MLFVVAARKRFFGFLFDLRSVFVHRLTAEHRRNTFVVEFEIDRNYRVVLERRRGVGHVFRMLHHAQLAAITNRQAFERFDDVERHSAAVKRFVRATFGPREHEADTSVGQIDATRHLAAAFVRPIREPEPTPVRAARSNTLKYMLSLKFCAASIGCVYSSCGSRRTRTPLLLRPSRSPNYSSSAMYRTANALATARVFLRASCASHGGIATRHTAIELALLDEQRIDQRKFGAFVDRTLRGCKRNRRARCEVGCECIHRLSKRRRVEHAMHEPKCQRF